MSGGVICGVLVKADLEILAAALAVAVAVLGLVVLGRSRRES
jgi:hypothetical protein